MEERDFWCTTPTPSSDDDAWSSSSTRCSTPALGSSSIGSFPARDGTFLYFAYGSNLCADRLRIRNPSAKLVSVGRLQGYKLAFNRKAKSWCGGVGDIVAAPDNEEMWGAVWELCMSDSDSLDAQEGVSQKDGVDVGHYKRLQVSVTTSAGLVCSCRTYVVVKTRAGLLPSPAYKGCILTGALAVGLPSEYMEELRALKDNNYSGEYADKFEPFVQAWLEAAAAPQPDIRASMVAAEGRADAASKPRPANFEIVMAAARLSFTLREQPRDEVLAFQTR